MMGKPKISYVIAVYNAERTLKECLDGIFKQNIPWQDYEVIIVDGESKDGTIGIIREYMKNHKNIQLISNPHRLSEGKGMGKDQGINIASGEFIIILDHDNILIGENWLDQMLLPLKKDKDIMASQSLLSAQKRDTLFLNYINTLGVEDPFAVPYSLVAQVNISPEKFNLIKNEYYTHTLSPKKVLFGGANGCIFRKEVFHTIEGYTRDVDVFAAMAEYKMRVAVPKNAFVHHKTSTDLLNFIKKKGIYFYRFLHNDYGWKKFKWIRDGAREKIAFALMIFFNLSFIGPFFVSLKQWGRTGKKIWFLHPAYLFFITIEYAGISMLKIKNFFRYTNRYPSLLQQR